MQYIQLLPNIKKLHPNLEEMSDDPDQLRDP